MLYTSKILKDNNSQTCASLTNTVPPLFDPLHNCFLEEAVATEMPSIGGATDADGIPIRDMHTRKLWCRLNVGSLRTST